MLGSVQVTAVRKGQAGGRGAEPPAAAGAGRPDVCFAAAALAVARAVVGGGPGAGRVRLWCLPLVSCEAGMRV